MLSFLYLQTITVDAFVVSKQWNLAKLFFRYFETMGVSPNLETYNVLLKISCKKKQFDNGRLKFVSL